MATEAQGREPRLRASGLALLGGHALCCFLFRLPTFSTSIRRRLSRPSLPACSPGTSSWRAGAAHTRIIHGSPSVICKCGVNCVWPARRSAVAIDCARGRLGTIEASAPSEQRRLPLSLLPHCSLTYAQNCAPGAPVSRYLRLQSRAPCPAVAPASLPLTRSPTTRRTAPPAQTAATSSALGPASWATGAR